jgi:hypothetical protein
MMRIFQCYGKTLSSPASFCSTTFHSGRITDCNVNSTSSSRRMVRLSEMSLITLTMKIGDHSPSLSGSCTLNQYSIFSESLPSAGNSSRKYTVAMKTLLHYTSMHHWQEWKLARSTCQIPSGLCSSSVMRDISHRDFCHGIGI